MYCQVYDSKIAISVKADKALLRLTSLLPYLRDTILINFVILII